LRKRRGEPSGIRFVDGRWLDMWSYSAWHSSLVVKYP
jgi:hypothetical protein